ncbi:MAG: carbon-monoxide dehydrogenase large subunit [Loktanella salsilacus]|jgi:carbon-monoxide dehydrogenase large subunit|uniref:Xanthine dehydrogenase, molybdenum binding subunit apoprotein n=3 Tax=Loktanella salsilacus TaxID=195913 RepID=A0A1I4H260_9RHOB|nr:xanthine dehydrogenase family protein molybdopterin-binding subunit [Loktanella salsilacus]MBU0779403.1 xanthine dehydrogenase family protein molybdopterin-binding subunit [Alphaproteobacteria bacterium]MBU1837437.1 xanthine dehydrogenase family protein molybdopterin-binding subunit [Alphaproteobacteria bacterium]UTH43607.1 xanthine dehydrogenase family protein molybdopterin-binding subunit [Loktanella salsilacus]UTH47323.1 xanthine dehydrogenase family protein molybdopterin-binding subunit |tara:strand:+ start:425 stop:2788 length:2364 start_codon:yes stop_codon:yes gene_type:complete
MPKDSGIGASSKRREDVRFLTGTGNYTDDINIYGQLHVHFLRADVAHAVLNGVDTSAAEGMPGVQRIFTGADFEAVGSIPCGWLITDRHGDPMQEPRHPVLAHGKIRHVGEPICAVVADTLAQARDAAEAIVLDYDALPAVIDMKDAIGADAPKVHDDLTGNLCYDWGFVEENRQAVDDAIKGAAHVTTLELVNNRLIANPMEPRVAVGEYNRADDFHTLHTTSQNPHVIRLLMGAFVLGIPEHKLRVVAPDVGGGFGTKIFHYQEEAFVTFAAKALNRPVKWTSTRSEAFMSDAHGRDHVTKIELALDAENNFVAVRTETYANMGAYLSTFASCTPTWLHGTLMAGNYKTPHIYVNVKAVFTNTVPVDAYRGAGRPEATFQLERVIDMAAHELGVDPIALRRQNFITEFPYATPVAVEYDTGDYHATMDKLIDIADFAGFDARRAESEAKGKLRGLGVNCYIEACGIAPSNLVGQLGARAGLYDAATVRVNATGSISVMVGAHSHGQGHETSFPQVISEMIGIPEDQIDIVHGDTSKIPFGMGTYGSRSLAVCGSAMVRAAEKVINKAKKIAAHLMEASEGDIELKDGRFSVAGTDKSVAWGDVTLAAYVPHNYPLTDIEPGLEETAFYDPANFTYPSGAYSCEVELDPETGHVKIERFCAADDFGNIINPMIVSGQVHGGIAQGIGQAMMEGCAYDSDGQLLSASYMDYAMPRAGDVPFYTVDHSCQTPCTHNPLGVKGCGEAGAIGSPPSLVNAVLDAINSGPGKKVAHINMPLTPSRVWAAMQ